MQFEELPPKTFGVIRYSGLERESTNRDMAVELRKWLEINSDYGIIAGPNYAGYVPPWTIPFLRRNEILYKLKAIKKQ